MAKKFKDLADMIWEKYRVAGMKSKTDKKSSNCVPEETEVDDSVISEADEVETSDYKVSPSGRKVRAKHLVFHNQDDDEKEVVKEESSKHRVLVTYSDPSHTMVSMRNEKQQKHVRVTASSRSEAEDLAKRHIKKKGYRVHEAEHVGMVNEKLDPSMGAGEYIKDFQKSDAPQFKGKSKEKRRMMGLAAYLQAKRQMKEEAEQIEEASYKGDGKVETKKYSWGTMKTVHHGHEFSIPLHPEHHQAIHGLKDQQEHKFKDETGHHWTAKRSGDKVHFHSANNGPKTTVNHADLKEEVENIEESMADSWKKVQSMDKGSVTGGKEEVRKRLAYLNAVHDHHKRFGNDTKKVKAEIESINRTHIAEDLEEGYVVRYNNPKSDKHGSERNFDNEESAKKHADRGNSVDKSGGKYTVHKTNEKGHDVKEELKGDQHKLDKNKNGKLDKHDFKLLRKEEQENTVKSYKEFVQSLNEYNSKDGVYRHKGTYGGSHVDQDDDDEDDYGKKKPKAPAADAPKRGRGRPKGSSSGARQIGAATGKKKSGADYTGFKLHLPNTNK